MCRRLAESSNATPRQFSLLQLLSAVLMIGAGLGFASLALRLWDEPWAHDIAILTPLWYAAGALFFAACRLLLFPGLGRGRDLTIE